MADITIPELCRLAPDLTLTDEEDGFITASWTNSRGHRMTLRSRAAIRHTDPEGFNNLQDFFSRIAQVMKGGAPS